MTGPVRYSHFLQPFQRLFLSFPARRALHQKRHRDILGCCELRQQVVELPNESQFAPPKLRGSLFRELSQIELGEVYVTSGSPIKNSEDVQQGTLPGTRFTHDRKHFAGLHLERQILKEH